MKDKFEKGKELILIGISNSNKDENNKKEVRDAAIDLNHEEGAHGIDELKGNKHDEDTDHNIYYGKNSNYTNGRSPDDEQVETDPKYKDSPAKKAIDEIDRLQKEFF